MKNMYVVLVLAMLLTTSCINTKRIVYLEDMREDFSYPMNAQPEMRIQRDDRLSIIVNSRNPELTVPFNISTGGDFQVTSNGDVSTTAGSQKQETTACFKVCNHIRCGQWKDKFCCCEYNKEDHTLRNCNCSNHHT